MNGILRYVQTFFTIWSTGYLLLRYATHGSPPVVRQLPWHPDRPIQSMTFDPSATWLLCVTAKDVLYIVPALALMVRQFCNNRMKLSKIPLYRGGISFEKFY